MVEDWCRDRRQRLFCFSLLDVLSHRPMVSSGIDDALKEILQITLRKSIIVLQQLFLSFYESYLSVLLFIFSATYGALCHLYEFTLALVVIV